MLSAKLLDAAASHLPSAPSLAVLVRARDDPRSLHDGCSHHARHKLLHHANGSSGSCSAAAAQRRGVRGHALMLVTDSRPPVNSIDAYWSVSAAANALYAHIHGYDFVYAVLPESARFKRAATARSGRLSNHSHEVLHRRGRLPTWCRLVVVAAALDLGYAWVAALDSDTVIHQPYAKLGVLLRFAEREQTTSGSPSGKGIAAAAAAAAEARREGAAAIAMSNSWWTRGAPCAGNMVWRNQPLALPLLARWWAYDAEGVHGAVGKREQTALWHLLANNATLAAAVLTADARSLWCIEGERRVREGCRHHVGCAADYFFCHLPHYPHGGALRRTANRSVRLHGLDMEARQLEAAAATLGCRPEGARPCSRDAGFAVINVTEADLQQAAAELLPPP